MIMKEKKLPSFEELFGDLDYSSADEYRSVLSPAAYLTDIMNLKDWKYGEGDANVDAVDDRRQDISRIPLNAENTITEIPHLDVVNGVMENKIAKLTGGDAYEALRTSAFPFNIPFNRKKTELRILFDYFKTDPCKFYQLFTATPNAVTSAKEYLGLSDEEFAVITTSLTDEGELKKCYGIFETTETLQSLTDVKRLRKAAELSALQVTELLFQDLSDQEQAAGVSKRFFINAEPNAANDVYLKVKVTDDTTQSLPLALYVSESSASIPVGYFDRIHRFIRLSRKTELSFADLDLILTSLCESMLDASAIKTIAVVKWLQKRFDVPTEELCALFAAMKNYGKGGVTEPADFFYRAYDKGHESDILSLSPTTDVVELKNRIQSALGLSDSDYSVVSSYLKAAGQDIATQSTLTVEWLTLPYRLKKLASLLELEISQLLTLLMLVDRNSGLIEKAKFPLQVDYSSTQPTAAIITGQASKSDALWLVQLMVVLTDWINASELTVEQLEFICTEHSDGDVEDVLSGSAITDLVSDVAGQFEAALFKAESLQSAVIDSSSAARLFEQLSVPQVGILTARGVIARSTTKDELLPIYAHVIKAKLYVEPADFQKTELADDVLAALFSILRNRDFIDLDNYISNLDYFQDSGNTASFLPELDRPSALTIFREFAERVSAYGRATQASAAECEAIAQKLAVLAGRQKSLLLHSLEDGLNLTADCIELLLVTLFRTVDETKEAAVVRFVSPLLQAVESVTALDAAWATSFRRLQQFGLLVKKTEMKAKELDVLLRAEDVQARLLEKLKLTPGSQSKIDASYVDTDGSVYLFGGGKYLRFSGKDYSLQHAGNLSDLASIPAAFASGINAALRDTGTDAADAPTYFFSGNRYSGAEDPATLHDTITRWGKVRNNIAEQNRIDAAYREPDETLFLFSGDQYVRYSPGSRDFVDEGYPKSTLRNWNNENRIKLPVDIRKNVDSIFRDADGTTYFFSDDQFVRSSDPAEVLKSKDHWGKVLNNIVDTNRIDAILGRAGKTYVFSGDQYVRYSGADYTYVDEGYPRELANHWNNEGLKTLSGDYLARIDSAFSGTDGFAYFFNGTTFVSTADNAAPSPINAKWGKVRNNVRELNRVDAAFVRGGKTYLFSGDQYVRYSTSDYSAVDESYPKRIAVNWNARENCGSLPDSCNAEINAAFRAADDSVYFFSGGQSISSKPGATLQEVKAVWSAVRNNIQKNNQFDAAFKAPDGKTYVFAGDQFYRYSSADYSHVDEGYPKAISDRWGALPDSFRAGIDAAFVFNVDGVDRLYLFKGNYYVRSSSSNYSQIDPGYPRELGVGPHPEGAWFNPIYLIRGVPHFRSIAAIFTDIANDKPRVNFFYRLDDGSEWFVKYEYKNGNYFWSVPVSASTLNIAPFPSVDCGFMGADGAVYLFSGTQFATRTGNYQGLSTPVPINGKWGKVLNRFIELNRVDGAFAATNAVYLFCDTQYVRYSGTIDPGNDSFYVDEGYPKTIAGNFGAENAGVALPNAFAAQGYEVLNAANGLVYAFSGSTFVSSASATPAPVNGFWGKVVNNIEALNRVDAAFVHAGKTYLFCGNQYTRYSGNYASYTDEGYPRKIDAILVEDGIAAVAPFPDGIDAIEDGADGNTYVIRGGDLVSSAAPTQRVPLASRFGAVRNNIAATGIIDSADLTATGVLYLFCGDQYCRYSGVDRAHVDESYPKSIANWNNFESGTIPASVTHGILASFTDTDGKTYLFTETEYFVEGNPSSRARIDSRWGKVVNNIQDTGVVDAAFNLVGGALCLFSGNQYALYSGNSRDYLDEGYPKQIAQNWGELPLSYRQGIDAGLVFDGRTYLMKGNEYVRYSDPNCQRIDTGFPRPIAAWMNEKPEFPLNCIKTFQQFEALSRKFSAKDRSMLVFLDGAAASSDPVALLATVTKWPTEDLTFLLTPQDGVLSDTDCRSVQVLSELNGLFETSVKMGSMPKALKQTAWNEIHKASALNLPAAANILYGLLKTVTGAAGWVGLSKELHNKNNLARRDALLGFLIYHMEQTVEDNWIDNPRALYEYLLIDVEMGEEAITSRIQEAIMCMQLFYHRTLMNLEDEDLETMDNVRHKLKSWWPWMKNYRVWEANRKVFLYPENYIRPELRDTKSPEFKELEEALLQSDITTDAAERAYKTYLDKFTKLANLRIAGGYVYQRNLDPDQTESSVTTEKKIIIFGHTKVEPKKYYYMTGVVLDPDPGSDDSQVVDWAPWKEIGITINASAVSPVYSFNRLFVFWVEDRKRDQSTYESRVSPDDQKIQHDPVIYYSFQNHHGEWTPPQELANLGSSVDKISENNRRLFIEYKGSSVNVSEVFNGARLYVTNPITSTHYDADEYIYVSYEARYKADSNLEFTFEGKVKADLTFESGTDVSKAVDRIEKNIEFPFAKFGITAVDSVNHWKGYFNDSFSAPWFSFNAAGGSFLAKPSYVQDGPIQTDKPENGTIKLLGADWTNLPDSGFTDQNDRKHLFFRQDINGPQLYAYVNEHGEMSAPVPVTDRWGKRNVFEWYPEDIACVAADGGELYIATATRHVSYSGADYAVIDQETIAATLGDEELAKLLPATMRPISWHLVKQDLFDFIDNLQHAFVFADDQRLYLVARIPDEAGGQPVQEYTVPSVPDFWREMASAMPAGATADTLRTWQAVDSAAYYQTGGVERLYLRNLNDVFVRDYIANSYGVYSVDELTHPDLSNVVYDALPSGSVAISWGSVETHLTEFLGRLAAVSQNAGSILLVASVSGGGYEHVIPEGDGLFDTIADIIDDEALSPLVAGLTQLTAAKLFNTSTIKRLYLLSGETVVAYDYGSAIWTVRDINELRHPDFASKVTSLDGLIPSGSPSPWEEVAQDLGEFLVTVERAIVWKETFYLLTPKAGGGYEFTSPSAQAFWRSVGEKLANVSGFVTVDAAAVIRSGASTRLYVTSGSNVAIFDYSSQQWSLSTIHDTWGVAFEDLNGLVQLPDGAVYLFSGQEYAENTGSGFTVAPVSRKWGNLKNVIELRTEKGDTGRVDAAFMDGAHRVYLIIGDYVLRYSNVDSSAIDVGFADVTTRDYFHISDSELKEEFASYEGNIEIQSIGTNTAFVQNVHGEEKLYLFVDISAKITKYTWKTRWVWWGGWRWRSYLYQNVWHSKRRRIWWGWWFPERYLVAEVRYVRKSAYVRASSAGEAFETDFDYPKVITGAWTNLPGDFNQMITATFEDKDEHGNDVFYVVRSVDETTNGQIRRTYDGLVKYTGKQNFPAEIAEVNYEILRLTSGTSEVLAQRLLVGGIDSLLSLATQNTTELPVFSPKDQNAIDIVGEEATDESVPMTLNDVRKNDIVEYKAWNAGTENLKYLVGLPESNRLDFRSINGQYYWELFFHAPFLIAQAFNEGQNFDEARRWFEYVFDPTEQYTDTDKNFWKFVPFHDDLDDDGSYGLSSQAQYRRYQDDPFDPHAIAELRQIAYRKCIVMAYIDNLLDHGDMLFRQYTRETINEARMLYVLAYDLLGKKPELLGTRRLSRPKTYQDLNELSAEYQDLNMALVEVENAPENAVLPASASIDPNGSILDVVGYFYIPENREFADYWDRVEDRLRKIRLSLNIDGIKQSLALFEPPLDVMALVKAVGSGLSLSQALADFKIDVPHYRFGFMLSKARELTSRVIQLGQSLLGALEKKDAEELSLLRNTQEHGVLEMTLAIKNDQLRDCEETLNSLRVNLKSAKTREAHYSSLIANGLSANEQSQLALLNSSQVFTNMSQLFSILSSASGIAPEAGVFAFHWGGHNLAALFNGLSQGFGAVSSNLSMAANMASILGGHQRRGQDWGLQQKLASCDIESIGRQIAGAELKAAIARQEIEIAKRNIKNNESVDTFMTGKFTNKELYRWMAGRLSGLYFQTYQMALDLAKMAQKSLQFELGYEESQVGYITSVYWDSLRKGLLSGEALQVDLDRMEKAHLEKNRRRFEISKTISLAELDPLALLELRDKRVCEFSIGEEQFDFDFPGHFCRQIKSISLTLPAVVGPYKNLNATLTQLSHKTLIEAAKEGLDHLLDPSKPQPLSVRANWRMNEQVALSRSVNDSGLFQLNFQDERYLPFEGTGAVSTWRLELNGQPSAYDVATLTDVIIKLDYTALQGGDVFAADVKKLLKKREKSSENPLVGATLLNLSREFSAEWNAFLANPSQGISFKVTRDLFESLGKANRIGSVFIVYRLSKQGIASIGDTPMSFNGVEVKPATLVNANAAIAINGSRWSLIPTGNVESFTPDNIADIAFVGIYEKRSEV